MPPGFETYGFEPKTDCIVGGAGLGGATGGVGAALFTCPNSDLKSAAGSDTGGAVETLDPPVAVVPVEPVVPVVAVVGVVPPAPVAVSLLTILGTVRGV